ncbi:MAG TPA: tetratricopeptide repeat protein, partial [Candidatus Melainabacteria bacterium]|nr:tetratricopeptide repeat protein [Candidatus Melainabacteria bacterium]
SKQAPKAVADLKEAETKFPRNPDVILALADALAASGKVGEGIMTAEKAMELDKSDVDAIVKHGLLSVRFGNKMRAVEDFGEAIKLDPKNILAYKNRGMLYLQQEKFASAQEDLSKVLSLDASQSEAKTALEKARVAFAKITRVRSTGSQRVGPSDAYLASLASKPFETLISDGYNAYKKGDYLTAVPTLEQAVKVNPKDPRGRRYLAYAYKQADQLGEAAGQFEVLYSLGILGPQDTSTYIEMMMGSGQQDKAQKIIEDSIAKNPGSQILYLHLANCQVTRGESDKAVQTCNRGIAINPRSAAGLQLLDLRRSILSGQGSGGDGSGSGDSQPPGA